MPAMQQSLMSVSDFLAWSEKQPGRWELLDGAAIAMSPERVVHGEVKYRVARALDAAISKAGIRCRFVLDSAGVRINEHSLYQPDALVYCGNEASANATEIPNPLVVFEVLSPGNAATDLRDKLRGYFRVASIEHYLIVDPDKRLVIHHARGDADRLTTRIAGEGVLRINPPGIELAVSDLLPEAYRSTV
jgi:Uma2 family endonuclease